MLSKYNPMLDTNKKIIEIKLEGILPWAILKETLIDQRYLQFLQKNLIPAFLRTPPLRGAIEWYPRSQDNPLEIS